MSDKDNLHFHEGDEEEFHVTDEDIDRELAAMEEEQPAATPSDSSADDPADEKPAAKKRSFSLKQLKRKHWIMLIVLIIFLFVLIRFMSNGRSSSSLEPIAPIATPTQLTTAVPKIEKATKPAVEVSPVATSLPEAPKSESPSNNAVKTEDTAKLTEILALIQKQNQTLTQQMTTLSQRVVGLESALTQSKQTVEDLSQQLVTSKQPITSSATILSSALVSPSVTLPPEPQYTVEAVVPQRAWVQTSNGSTLTVTVGDDVPGLGAVTEIDPYSGNVTTASGTIIKYGN